MKKLLLSLITLCLLGTGIISVSAKRQPVPKMYMFGLAASFTDTIVHFTPIQTLDSAWIESKNGFLLERDVYSFQLREYLESELKIPHRTCVVFYNQKREKLEKKYKKIQRLYTKSKDGLQHFDIRYLEPQQFQFKVVDMSEYEDGGGEDAENATMSETTPTE